MSKIALEGNASGTGTFTLASPNSSTDRTLTLPDNTGTIITTASTFAGTGPAFSAYLSANQSVSNSTLTKIQFNIEEFDTASCYDNSTNYRFTPNVAGYYQVGGQLTVGTSSITRCLIILYKNGSLFKVGNDILSEARSLASALIYFNGTTDYVEAYGLVTATTPIFRPVNVGADCYFYSSLVRAA